MRFTVTRPAESKDAEFEAYARLLRQQGKALGDLPRVPDPANPRRRWVHVWDTQAEAQQFADQLTEQTGGNGWHVEPTTAAPSRGPFGPLLIQMAHRSDGLGFTLHPLSRAMIREAFPNATPAASSSFIDVQNWDDYRKMQGDLHDLVNDIMPVLTGLDRDQLGELGYAVIDADTERTWVYEPPARIIQLPI